jgi:hypothetical protein
LARMFIGMRVRKCKTKKWRRGMTNTDEEMIQSRKETERKPRKAENFRQNAQSNAC